MSWIDSRLLSCLVLAALSAGLGLLGVPMLYREDSLLAFYGVNALQLLLVFALPALLILASRKSGWQRFRAMLRPVGLRTLSATVLMAVGGTVTLAILALLWASLLQRVTGYTGAELPLPIPQGVGQWAAALLFIAVTPACCEELFFRAMIQQTLLRRWPRAGLWITALIFAALHFRWEVFPALLLVGLVLGLTCRRYGYWAAALMHALYNAATLTVSARGGTVSLALIAASIAACAVACKLLFEKELADETDRSGL